MSDQSFLSDSFPSFEVIASMNLLEVLWLYNLHFAVREVTCCGYYLTIMGRSVCLPAHSHNLTYLYISDRFMSYVLWKVNKCFVIIIYFQWIVIFMRLFYFFHRILLLFLILSLVCSSVGLQFSQRSLKYCCNFDRYHDHHMVFECPV